MFLSKYNIVPFFYYISIFVNMQAGIAKIPDPRGDIERMGIAGAAKGWELPRSDQESRGIVVDRLMRAMEQIDHDFKGSARSGAQLDAKLWDLKIRPKLKVPIILPIKFIPMLRSACYAADKPGSIHACCNHVNVFVDHVFQRVFVASWNRCRKNQSIAELLRHVNNAMKPTATNKYPYAEFVAQQKTHFRRVFIPILYAILLYDINPDLVTVATQTRRAAVPRLKPPQQEKPMKQPKQ